MQQKDDNNAWMLPIAAFEWIEKNIPMNSTILEFGSGLGTERLSENYCLYSVEHNPEWVWRYQSNYIYAPIVLYPQGSGMKGIGWYNPEIIFSSLPKEDFALIILDGPPNAIGRWGILDHLHILERSKFLLIDDLHRTTDFELSQEISRKMGFRCIHLSKTITGTSERHFGIFERVGNE